MTTLTALTPHYKRTAGWAFAAFLVIFFDTVLRAYLWLFVFAVWFVVAAVGIGIGIVGLVRAKRDGWSSRTTCAAFAPFVVMVALVLLWIPLSWAGDAVVFRTRFAIRRSTYDAIVAGVISRRLATAGEYRGVQYQTDGGLPIRVAFPQPGGIIDNWEGVIYDPTGAVRAATGWRGAPGNFSAPPAVRGLFGGDLLVCEPVNGAYYRCWFT